MSFGWKANMGAYVFRRLLNGVPVLLLISVAAFALTSLLPGDPVQALLGPEATLTPEAEARLRRDLGLDRPWPAQYLLWLRRIIHGDFGTSIQTRRPVLGTIAERLPVTLQLALPAWCIAIGLSIPLGAVAAVNRNSWLDHCARLVAVSGIAVPSFWMGLMFIYVFSVWTELLPPSGFVNLWADPGASMTHLLLPALTLGLHMAGPLTRQTRSAMLEVLGQEYIRTAWAKGLTRRQVLVIHVLRNALLPVITLLGIQAGALVGGTVVIEQVFAIPGMGRLAVSSVFAQDLPVLQGIVVLAGVAVVLANLLTDIAYSMLDPRIRHG